MLPFTRVCLCCSFHSVSMNTNQFIIALFALGMCTHLVSAGPALWAANEAYIDALNPTASLSTDGGLVNLTWVVDDVVAGFVYDVSFVGRTCNLTSAIVMGDLLMILLLEPLNSVQTFLTLILLDVVWQKLLVLVKMFLKARSTSI